MCEHGMNADQMKVSIGQSQSTLGLVEEWLGRSAHVAGHAERSDVEGGITRARTLVGEARELLAGVIEDLDMSPDDTVTVERI